MESLDFDFRYRITMNTMEYCKYIKNRWSSTGMVDIVKLGEEFTMKPSKARNTIQKWIKKGNIVAELNPARNILMLNPSLARPGQEVRENVIPVQGKSQIDAEKMKTRLFGMIKTMKKIDLAQAPAMLGIDKQTIQQLLFDLVGEGKIDGEFVDDNVFIIVSGVDVVLTALDSQFAKWGDNEQNKEGKLEFTLS